VPDRDLPSGTPKMPNVLRADLPTGTVTFLFTDVEGSTKLLHELGAEEYSAALMEHRRLLREAFVRHGGVEVDTQGDAFFVALPTAPGALAAAAEAQAALAAGPIRVRMGIHTGTPHLGPEGYIGADVHAGARIAAAGHGGQVLVSAATAALVDGEDLRDLGAHRLKDLSGPQRIYQLGGGEHPPLKTLHQTNLPVPATPFLGREQELGRAGRAASPRRRPHRDRHRPRRHGQRGPDRAAEPAAPTTPRRVDRDGRQGARRRRRPGRAHR